MIKTLTVSVSSVDCCACGFTIWLDDGFIRHRRDDHKWWYCNSCGKPQHWAQQSESERLRAQLASSTDLLNTVRSQRDETQRRLNATKGVVTRIKNSVGNGKCPCCGKTFRHLQHHMRVKHPEFADSETD